MKIAIDSNSLLSGLQYYAMNNILTHRSLIAKGPRRRVDPYHLKLSMFL